MRQLNVPESLGVLDHLNDSADLPGEVRKSSRDRVQGKPMADNVQAVNDANFDVDVIEASKTQPVMVDFFADWCRPCHMLAPTVAEIASEYVGKLKVVKMNVDENISSAGNFNIRSIPTLLIFKGGQVAEQIMGAVPKEQISKAVDRHIS